MLILTEKPSVARAFAEALKVPRKDNFWENEKYCIVNALGHLLEDYAPEDYDPALKKWSLEGLPVIPEEVKYKVVENTKSQLAVIKNVLTAGKTTPYCLPPMRNAKANSSARKYSIMSASQITPMPGVSGCPKPSRLK